MTRNRVEAVFILLLVGGYLWGALSLPFYYRFKGVPDPSLFPMFLGAVMGIAAVWQLFAPDKKEGEGIGGKVRVEKVSLRQRALASGRFYFMWGVVLAYVFLLPTLGFVISSGSLLLAFFFLLGERRWYLALGIAAAVTLGVYFLFTRALGVNLPAGLLRGILGR